MGLRASAHAQRDLLGFPGRDREVVVVSADITKAVIDHHVTALLAGDIDAVMADYTEDWVLISNLGGVVKGLAAIRAMIAAAGEFPGFEETAARIEGELGTPRGR